MKNKGKEILSVLPRGQDLSMPGEVLCRLLKIDDRQLRILILQMRKNGQPILSDNRGYFLPGQDGQTECLRFIRRQLARARSSFHSIRGAKKYLDKDDQLSLLDLFDDVVNL